MQTGHDWLVVRRVAGVVDAAALALGERLTAVDGDVVITTDQDGRAWRVPLTRGRRLGETTVVRAWPADVGRWLETHFKGEVRELRAALLERPAPSAD